MPDTMRAIRLIGPVSSDDLIVTEVPIPDARPGWVRIRVMAFGVNESEVTAASGCMDPRRQRIISALLSAGLDQTELVDALRIRFIDATSAAMRVAVHEPADPEWPRASIELAVVVGLLTGLPHITGHPIDRADFERIVDEALLPLLSHRFR